MARRRSVLTLLIFAAFTSGSWAQNPAAEAKPQEQKPDSPPCPQSPAEPQKQRGEDQGRKPGVFPPPADGSGEGRDGREGRGRRDWKDRRARENLTPEQIKERAMRDLEKLTPEQRNEVWRAVWAVLNMPAEKKQELIGAENERWKKAREEIERAIQSIGVKIPDDQRRKFFHRYFSGRRAIEEQLKTEGEERRKVLTDELHAKLKQEFGNIQQQVEQNVQEK